MVHPDVKRYLVAGDAGGSVLTLRGHDMAIPRLLQIVGALALLGAAVGVWGIVTSPGDEVPLAIAIAGTVLGGGMFGYGTWRPRHPDATLVIDKVQQTLTIRRGNLAPHTIPFRQLGTMKLGAMTTGMRASAIRHAVIGLSQHPDVILYDPWSEADLNCFAVTLRHVIGEEFLPRAQRPATAPPASG